MAIREARLTTPYTVDVTTNANWEINEDILTVSLSGQIAVTAEILELNSATLKYKISNQDANGDGNNDEWTTTMEKRN